MEVLANILIHVINYYNYITALTELCEDSGLPHQSPSYLFSPPSSHTHTQNKGYSWEIAIEFRHILYTLNYHIQILIVWHKFWKITLKRCDCLRVGEDSMSDCQCTIYRMLAKEPG